MIPPECVDISAVMRSGIYFLLWKGKVIYVGQSVKLYQRIASHLHSRAKDRKVMLSKRVIRGVVFDQIYVMPCALSDIDRLEKHYINEYQPLYNEKGKVAPAIGLGDLLKNLVISGPPVEAPIRRRV